MFPEAMAHATRTSEERTSENSSSPMSRRIPVAALVVGFLLEPELEALAVLSNADRFGGVGFIVGDDVCLSSCSGEDVLLERRKSASWRAER